MVTVITIVHDNRRVLVAKSKDFEEFIRLAQHHFPALLAHAPDQISTHFTPSWSHDEVELDSSAFDAVHHTAVLRLEIREPGRQHVCNQSFPPY